MTLFAFGSNGCGQLGIGHTEDTNTPQPCRLSEAQGWPSPIRTVKGGGSHTLVLLESGELYVSGSLTKQRAGLDQSSTTICRFHPVPSTAFEGSRVKLCSALWEASVVVTTDNDIYTFGAGSKCELGLGKENETSPRKLQRFWPLEEQIVDLSSGMSHTLAVLSNGEVYGWGNGRKGQLGEPAQIVLRPRKIQNLGFNVVRALCGREFSYLVGDPKDGHHAIIGSDKYSIRSSAPLAIPNWSDIGASWGSIFVITKSTDFLAWGRSDHGQTGPERSPQTLVRIAAGSEHALALTVTGAVAAWGWGEHGNCGQRVDPQGDVKGGWNALYPDKFGKSSKVLGLAAGMATSFVWTVDTSNQSF